MLPNHVLSPGGLSLENRHPKLAPWTKPAWAHKCVCRLHTSHYSTFWGKKVCFSLLACVPLSPPLSSHILLQDSLQRLTEGPAGRVIGTPGPWAASGTGGAAYSRSVPGSGLFSITPCKHETPLHGCIFRSQVGFTGPWASDR